MNLYGVEFITRLCLFAEWIGVCHFSWLLFQITSRLACGSVMRAQKTLDSSDVLVPPSSPTALNREPDFKSALVSDRPLTIFDLCRYTWSTALTLLGIVIIMYGISERYYVFPTPVGATYALLFAGLTGLFYLEGLMIGRHNDIACQL